MEKNADNLETIKDWKQKVATIAFVFDMVLEKYQKKVYLIELLQTVFAYFSTMASLSVFGIQTGVYPALDMAVKAGAFILTFATSITVTILRITGWKKLVDDGFKYLHKVESLSAKIGGIDIKNPDDLDDFIKKHREEYIAILDSAPDIPHSDYLKAIDSYEKSANRFRNDLIVV